MQRTRDVALTIMAVLVSLVCAGILYVAFTAGSALSDLTNPDPEPSVTFNDECYQVDPPADC